MQMESTDVRKQRAREKVLKREHDERAKILRDAMSHPEVRLMIANLFDGVGAGACAVDPVRVPAFTVDMYATAMEIGKQSVVRNLIDEMLEHCPEAYMLMLDEMVHKEARARESQREERFAKQAQEDEDETG